MEEKRKEYYKKWKEKNKEHFKKYQREYKKKVYWDYPLIRKTNQLQFYLNHTLRTHKQSNLSKDLNYTSSELIKHMEKQFNNKMTWLNYGIYWEIDHIKPTSQAKTEEELIKLYELSNLRPLEKTKNKLKGGK